MDVNSYYSLCQRLDQLSLAIRQLKNVMYKHGNPTLRYELDQIELQDDSTTLSEKRRSESTEPIQDEWRYLQE